MAKTKQVKIEEIPARPIKICGIRQNCYAVDLRARIGDIPSSCKNITQKKYYALEQKMLPNGFIEELVEKDYPINSDSVSSYVEASDYRNDPLAAIANAPKRVNLGDITGVQDFLSSNPVQAMQHYTDILKKVQSYLQKQAGQTPQPPQAGQTPQPPQDINKGGNN